MLMPQRPSSVFPSNSLSPLVVCKGETTSPSTCSRGQKDRLHAAPSGKTKQNIYIPSQSRTDPSPPSPYPMPHFLFSIFLTFASDIFSPSPALHSNLLQNHADSWFVYQNIDLFSLYTFTLHFALGPFPLILVGFFFLLIFPLAGSPDVFFLFYSFFLSWTCWLSSRQEGRERRNRAVFIWELSGLIGSVGLYGGISLIWSLFFYLKHPFSHWWIVLMLHGRCSHDWNVLFFLIGRRDNCLQDLWDPRTAPSRWNTLSGRDGSGSSRRFLQVHLHREPLLNGSPKF